ncbi:hypothetical protein [Porticoccus litoralis]|uniref:Uncharacterized protein n=1 Tax=Porticoccus litoralis TaxID=434086 RepID=A0AAW8B026_9GAMM|nr:hypothetical protein [Porticoccus litoralis]MDP1519451.1 hypothetical protein [Porticoccus litoralis]TNE93093.1 MAG: hypothetical protein EP324_03950 [Gammaproteobacteria bacterium]
MIFTAGDLRHLVIRETLNYLNDWSQAAENLLLGTAAHESGLGGWHEGRRVGLYRITPSMHRTVWDNYLIQHPELASDIRGIAGQHSFLKDPHGELATNLKYATAIAWMIYRRAEQALPDPANIGALGTYWHRHFRSRPEGSAKDFVTSYQLLIRDETLAAA